MTTESSSPLDAILTRWRRLLRTPLALAVLASVWVLGSVMLALGIAVTMKLIGQRASTSSSATPMAYGLTQKNSLILLVGAVSLHLVLLVFLLGSILSDRPSSVQPHLQSLHVREEVGTKTEDTTTNFQKDLPPCYEAVLLAETPPPPFHSTIWRTPSLESLKHTSCLNSYVTLPMSDSLIPDADRPKMTSCDSKNAISYIDDVFASIQDFDKKQIKNIKTDILDEVICYPHHQPDKNLFLEIDSCSSFLNNSLSNNDRSELEKNIAYLPENESLESVSTNPNYKRNHKGIYAKINSRENLGEQFDEELSSNRLYNLAERQGKFINTGSPYITASRSSKEFQRNYSLKTPSTSKLVNSKVLLSHSFKGESQVHFSAVEELGPDITCKQKYTKSYKTAGDHSFDITPLLHGNNTIKKKCTNMSHHTFTKPQNSQPETTLSPALTCISTENMSHACTSLPPHALCAESTTKVFGSTLSQHFLLPYFQPVLNLSKSVSNQSLESGIHSCSSLVSSRVMVNTDSKDSVNSYEIMNDSPKIIPDSAIGSIVSVNVCL